MPDDQIDHAFVKLHKRWQETLDAMVADGVSYQDAAESMLTTALAAKLRAEGSLQLARSLLFIGNGLARLDAEPQQLH